MTFSRFSRFSRSKLCIAGWVSIRNLMNRHFKANRPCSICRTAKCEPAWFNVETGQVRCKSCFDP